MLQFSYLANVDVVPVDISVAGRILAAFPEALEESQRVPDNLAYLGQQGTRDENYPTSRTFHVSHTVSSVLYAFSLILVLFHVRHSATNSKHTRNTALKPDCSIVKLPNISAPVNQLQACIAELRGKGYNVPLYPTDPQTPAEVDIQARYQKVAGSAVNPVLREGNSDRRVAAPVKAYAQKNPHRMGLWSRASRTHVAHMTRYVAERTGQFVGVNDKKAETVACREPRIGVFVVV